MEKVNVVGLGYIGLPTALCLAVSGNEIIGTDNNDEVIANLQMGKVNFPEIGMNELFHNAINEKISFSSKYQKASIYIVAVPTPYNKDSKKVDPSYVVSAIKSILSVCDENSIIVIESTISPGTIDNYIRPLVKDMKIHLAHAPERIIPGNIIGELKYNSRTIGADSIEIAERIKRLYGSFCCGDIVTTDIRTAEMTKVVENTYRDINIAFANELAKICRVANLDVYEVIKIANMHPRVNILSPGPGVGGHCISVDPWFLVGDYPGLANIILAARKINDSMPEFVLQRTSEIMKENGIEDISRVGFYGLTYKEDVDDTRESPTLQLIEIMQRHLGGNIKVYDPYVKQDIVKKQYHSLNDFINNVDLVVIMVGHSEIKNNPGCLSNKVVFDTRNVITGEGIYHI